MSLRAIISYGFEKKLVRMIYDWCQYSNDTEQLSHAKIDM